MRYVATPYSYNSKNRPSSWSVWDMKRKVWADAAVYGSREKAEKLAQRMNEATA